MKYYKNINLKHFEIIVKKASAFVKNRPEIYNRIPGHTGYELDNSKLLGECPELIESLAEHGLICCASAVYVMYKNKDSSIHIDGGPYFNDQARILLPLFNCKNTYTNFYSNVKIETSVDAIKSTNHMVINDDYELIDRFELTEPTVIRVREPHGVVMDEDNSPRISLILICNPDPIFLLN
jgi:hypothetical protein